MEIAQKNKIEKFLKSLKIDEVKIMDYINIEEIDLENPYDFILSKLDELGAFNIKITEYDDAIEYLKQNDFSLKESLQLAYSYNYNIKELDSKILASFLAGENAVNIFYDLKDDIDTFFNEITS